MKYSRDMRNVSGKKIVIGKIIIYILKLNDRLQECIFNSYVIEMNLNRCEKKNTQPKHCRETAKYMAIFTGWWENKKYFFSICIFSNFF